MYKCTREWTFQMKSKNQILRTLMLTSTVFCLHYTAANAQSLEHEQLDTVVIQADNNPNNKDILVDKISAKEISAKQVDNVRDISRLDPLINYNRQNNSFNIRGLDSNRVLTTIDGIPMPWLNDISRGVKGGPSSFDFGALTSLDIGRGSDSSLYGSGVLGGIVMLQTINPEDLIKNNKNWGSITKGSYDSSDNSWHINQAFAVKAQNTYVMLQGGYVDGKQRRNNGEGGGYGTARVFENPENYDQNNLLFKLNHYINPNHKIGFTAERFRSDRNIDVYNQSTVTYQAGTAEQEQKNRRDRFSLSYDYYGDGQQFLDRFATVFYWQNQENNIESHAQRLVVPKGDFRRNNEIKDENYGFTLRGEKKIETGTISHNFRFLADGSSSKFQQYASGSDSCPPPPHTGIYLQCRMLHTNQSDAPDTKSKSFGFSIEDEIGFFDNRLRLTPGGRFDWYEHNPQKTASFEVNPSFKGYPEKNNASRFSPKLRAEWQANNDLMFYAQWAQSFRAPSVTELYLDYTNPGIYHVIGNSALKAETGNGYDIGLKYGNETLNGSLGLFTNRYKNFIDYIELAPTREYIRGQRAYINKSRVKISGIEAKGQWQITHNWQANIALTYMEGKDTETGEYLNSIPPFKAVSSIAYQQENWGAELFMTAAAKRDKVAANSQYAVVPGFAVFDVTAWWRPIGEKGPRLQAGIYNIFDKTYWNSVEMPALSNFKKDYYSEPGRNFKISFVQEF